MYIDLLFIKYIFNKKDGVIMTLDKVSDFMLSDSPNQIKDKIAVLNGGFDVHKAENAYSSAHGVIGNANYLHTDNLLYTDNLHTVPATDDTATIQYMINTYGSIFIGKDKVCRITNSLIIDKPVIIVCHGTLWLETPNKPLFIIDDATAIENADIFVNEIKGIGKSYGQSGFQIKNAKFNRFTINKAKDFKYIVYFSQRDRFSVMAENIFNYILWSHAERAVYYENPPEFATILSLAIATSDATTMQLTADPLSIYPTLTYPYSMRIGSASNFEVVTVIGKTGSDYNINRAQQNTTAKTFTINELVELDIAAWSEGNQFNGGLISVSDKGVYIDDLCWAGDIQLLGSINNAAIEGSTDWENYMYSNRLGNLLLTRLMRWENGKCVFGSQDMRLEPNKIRGIISGGNIEATDGGGNSTQLNYNNGGIELAQLSGNPFIDFKTLKAVDKDARLYKTTSHALNFQTGGSTTIKEGFSIGPNGSRYIKNAGFNVEVAQSSGYIVVTLPYAVTDVNYSVQVTPTWNTTCYVPTANKGVSTFRIYFGTPPTVTEHLDWQMLKIM